MPPRSMLSSGVVNSQGLPPQGNLVQRLHWSGRHGPRLHAQTKNGQHGYWRRRYETCRY